MGDPGNMSEGSSSSMDDSSRSWTTVRASNTEPASRNKQQQHLDNLEVYDRFLVSVGRKIGEGGQGCVYEAKLHLPYSFKPLPVAVKKFKALDRVSQGQFPRELFSLKSSNLCVPMGFFFDEGESLCFIMRHYSCDLRAVIDCRMKALPDEASRTRGPPFTEEDGRSLILQLAAGVKALHECGISHRDLKAANILVKTSGKNYEALKPAHLVITDFETSDNAQGTKFFRAPEVLERLPETPRLSKEQWLLADVYSFGMMCYEVLTGMIPFHGHRQTDYDLVLNGGRPELPDHVPEAMRDLILRCWHADPHSRPNWSEIMEVLAPKNDDALDRDGAMAYINNSASKDSLSFESIIHESKQLVQDLTMGYESGSKSCGREFMPYYWASQLLATAKEYASKFEVGSIREGPLTCDVQEVFERTKLSFLMIHQMYGVTFGFSTLLDLDVEQVDTGIFCPSEITQERGRLQGMLFVVYQMIYQSYPRVVFTGDFGSGTSWTSKLLFFHTLVKWVLWYEYAEGGWERKFMLKCLIPTHVSLNSVIQALLISLCMIVNTYIYVLSMITYEPILLGLQYGLYKTKGCNNILYRSSGERICRFQRAWMNCTRYKLTSISLSFSFAILLTMYGWRGILGWILFPCVIMYTPYWRRPIRVKQ